MTSETPAFTKMTRQPAYVYEILRKRIIAGEYASGTQLKESHLAAELGVSRTPIRAALKRLIEDGLAVSGEGRGVFIASWTRWDIEDMFRLRIRLEPLAARLAASRADDSVLLRLNECNQRMARAIDEIQADSDALTDVQAANSEFHRTVLDASGSQRLISMLETVIEMPILMRSFLLYELEDLQRSLQHHRDLLLALEWRDEDLAELVMLTHLRITNQYFMRRRLDFSAPT